MAESSSRRVLDLGGDSRDSSEVTPEESLGAIVARTYVVGKILGDRRPHISQIRSQMMSVWYIKGDFRIIPKPNNIFLIGFELEEDKKKVLKGMPWLVSNLHLCLKGWFPDMILSQDKVVTRSAAKKRKVAEEVLLSPIKESARRAHTGMVNTVVELVTDLHDASPIHSSASKPSWKRMARTAKVKYQPSTLGLIQAFDMEVEARVNGMQIESHQANEEGVPSVPSARE
ncbi:hypothetical protein Tsubulata_013697 [Turnera subulata]|uniref:DUF4283 domain-containing protein n=1 Tax=Turnera subulata TaxID=218843 RepID=A0A9Q0JLL1_9ROSI|nr:hypothetical protein Tsubulata_013697 [Turnera subulata]